MKPEHIIFVHSYCPCVNLAGMVQGLFLPNGGRTILVM